MTGVTGWVEVAEMVALATEADMEVVVVTGWAVEVVAVTGWAVEVVAVTGWAVAKAAVARAEGHRSPTAPGRTRNGSGRRHWRWGGWRGTSCTREARAGSRIAGHSARGWVSPSAAAYELRRQGTLQSPTLERPRCRQRGRRYH